MARLLMFARSWSVKVPPEALRILEGRATPLRGSDIDTDRIIPARYLKVIRFDGLGEFAFYDERFDTQGNPRAHPLNEKRYRGSTFLVVERNFGSGSSREHAPQALMRFGFRGFIGISFAEIFQGNCLAMGLAAVTLSEKHIQVLLDNLEADPSIHLILNIASMQLQAGQERYQCEMPQSSQQSLVMGSWDSTGLLLANKPSIHQVAADLPYLNNFARK